MSHALSTQEKLILAKELWSHAPATVESEPPAATLPLMIIYAPTFLVTSVASLLAGLAFEIPLPLFAILSVVLTLAGLKLLDMSSNN